MKSSFVKQLGIAVWCFCALLAARPARAQVWRALGPEGGDVYSFGSDPLNSQRVYLGTADGHIFGSNDGGEHWELRGRAGPRSDSVVTAILVDPGDESVLYAATWTRDPAAGGGVFRSDDYGRSWASAGLAGEAVRALAIAPGAASGPPSASHELTLIAGTLDGVYRSRNSGKIWERISPAGDPELRNLDSVAVDPADADTIYVGTFHLPWKTSDGGLHWNSIHDGMIDDSDVMSLLADATQPGRIYASACSGIYRSDSGGAMWQKVQGIPYTARRTVEILQDPARPQIVFAATTEGLWKTIDAGSTWQLITPPDWSVTAMILGAGAADRVLIGVEQRGALASDDGGANFHPADGGFLHRQILQAAYVPFEVGAAPGAPAAQPAGRILIALANAPDFLLASEDGGGRWSALAPGPTQATLGRIYASPEGWLAALAGGGIERYDETKSAWLRVGRILNLGASKARERRESGALPGGSAALNAVVSDMAFAPGKWYAATPDGLLDSTDRGEIWTPVRVGALTKLPVESILVSRDGHELWLASLISIAHSADGGATWQWIDLPAPLGVARRLQVSSDDRADNAGGGPAILLITTDQGLFISRDAGKSWAAPGHGLPEAPVQDLATAGPIFLAAMQLGGLYLSRDAGLTWRRLEGSWADGVFSSLPAGAPLAEATGAGFPRGSVTMYAASITEGLYSIVVGPDTDLAAGSDTLDAHSKLSIH
jgi:photosystem II stability/assembly factor-like uncharacterized protein